MRAFARRALATRSARVGAALVALLVAFAVLGPALSPHDPLASVIPDAVAPDETPRGPSASMWLGADRLFRDVLTRLAVGARVSLLVGLGATALATVLGGVVGVVSGYSAGRVDARVPWLGLVGGLAAAALVPVLPGVGGALVRAALLIAVPVAAARLARLDGVPEAVRAGPDVDTVLMRLVDVQLAFPFLLLVMAISAAVERTGPGTVLLTLGLTGWLGTARVVRAETLRVRNLDYVAAARALGQSTTGILVRHVAPNVAGPLLVVATTQVGQMIVAESVLSFLGAGLPPPAPSWGRMLLEGQESYPLAPWLLVAPAVALVATSLGFNLLGEGLRDALGRAGVRVSGGRGT